jgi:hypothetical protein
MNDDEKQYQLNFKGLDLLDEKMLGALIDNLVDFYVDKFGLDTSIEEPDKPEYSVEKLDVVKDYLKKFRLNG